MGILVEIEIVFKRERTTSTGYFALFRSAGKIWRLPFELELMRDPKLKCKFG
jgi:hypothetical protein